MSAAEQEAALVRRTGAKRVGREWRTTCPCHRDKHPSLDFHAEGDRLLFFCRSAGCDSGAVFEAFRRMFPDIFPSRTQPGSNGKRSCREIPYELCDAHGQAVAVHVRREDPITGKKVGFYWRLPDGTLGLGGTPVANLPLYNLPALLHAKAAATKKGRPLFVIVCEGEKAADAATRLGYVAVATVTGASSIPSDETLRPLLDCRVMLWPDNDTPGRLHMTRIAARLVALGHEALRFVVIPDAKPKDDAADFRGTKADLNGFLRERLEEAVVEEPASGPGVASFTPFPVESLPEPFQSFVTKGAKALYCDPAHLALPILAGAASAIGNTRRLKLKRRWSEPPIIWAALVGVSGNQKSPAIELALEPIRQRQVTAMRRHDQEMRDFQQELAEYERDAAKWRKSGSEGAPPEKPEQPTADRCLTDDTTIEALGVLLQQNPRGLLMARDELSGWLGSFEQYKKGKGSDVPKWLEMHGGRPLVVDRKGSGVLHVPSAAVSVVGGIQPEPLRRALGREHFENGLAARLLLAYPPRRAKRWTEDEVDEATEAQMEAVFDRLFGLNPETDESGNERSQLLTLAPEAKAAWVKFFNEHATEQAALEGDLAAAWSKLEGYAARFALVIHLVRWAAGDPTIQDHSRVDAKSLKAGVSLSRWFGAEAQRIYALMAETTEEREQRDVADWIGRRPGAEATARVLAHGLRRFRNDTESAEEFLKDLAEAGFGRLEEVEPGLKGGRPTVRFRVYPPVTVTETPRTADKTGVSVTVTPSIGSQDVPEQAVPEGEDVIPGPPAQAVGP